MDDGKRWNLVWITGASSGIGRELACLLEGKAGKVAISARSADTLESLAADKWWLSPYPLDVTDEAAVSDCVRAIEAEHGPIDLAVLNAATWSIVEASDLSVDAIRRGVEVNYMGVVHALAALIPAMRRRGSGHIAIVASSAGYRGLPKSAAYGPTKAALINLAETLRSELKPFGITISLVNSGFVDTPMTRDNPFPMPFLIPVREAASRLLAGLERRKYEIVFPRRFVFGLKLLRILPNRIFFRIVDRYLLDRKG